LEFSTFDRKIFRILKFRAEIFSAREISGQKNSGGKNFSASVPGAIGRAGFCTGSCVPSVECGMRGCFFNFQPENFWIFQISRRIFFRPKNFAPENFGTL
jgi:hypothetical protein